MVVLLLAVELEILEERGAEDRAALMKEAAEAYRVRARLQTAAGRTDAARADERRAEDWEGEARKLQTASPATGRESELRELARQVEDLRKKMDRTLAEMRGGPSERRRANFPPSEGRIELVNAWTGPVTVLVDGTAYDLQPGEMRRLPRASGDFRYEVRGIQAPVTRKLEAGETFTIRVGSR